MSSWTFGYNTVNTSNPYCILTVTESSTSTSNNTSTLTATLVLKRPSSVSSSASKSWSMTIAGTSYSGTTTIGGSGDKTIASKTLTVSHDSDGSKTITCSASFTLAITWSGTYIGTISSGSKSMTLTTIARASSITSASSIYTDSACSIKWTPASSSFTYKVKFTVGSKSVTTGSISPNQTSAYTYTGYTMATSTWAPYITSAASATCAITLYTYSGSTLIGSKTGSFTLTIKTSVKPNIAVTYSDYYGYATTYGYLTNKSKVSYSITQSTSLYGATVTYKTVISGTTYTTSNTSATAGASGTSGYLTSSGSKTISVTATDSRGRTDSFSDTFTVYSYSSPTIGTLTVGRNTSDNTMATAVLSNATYSVCNGSNSLSATIGYKKASATSYTSSTFSLTVSSGTASGNKTWSTNTFDEDSSYDIQLTVTDSVGTSTSKTISLSTITVLMDFKEGGGGLGIGKIAEGDYLDVGMDAVFSGEVELDAGFTAENARWTGTSYCDTAGFISSSGLGVYFSIPYISYGASPTITINSIALRQAGSYLGGGTSSSNNVTESYSASYTYVKAGYFNIVITFSSAPTNYINNDVVGIRVNYTIA